MWKIHEKLDAHLAARHVQSSVRLAARDIEIGLDATTTEEQLDKKLQAAAALMRGMRLPAWHVTVAPAGRGRVRLTIHRDHS